MSYFSQFSITFSNIDPRMSNSRIVPHAVDSLDEIAHLLLKTIVQIRIDLVIDCSLVKQGLEQRASVMKSHCFLEQIESPNALGR